MRVSTTQTAYVLNGQHTPAPLPSPQIAYLNAQRYRIRRVFFGGFFIRGHPYTMETISYAFKFWSKGEIQALFLRHEVRRCC